MWFHSDPLWCFSNGFLPCTPLLRLVSSNTSLDWMLSRIPNHVLIFFLNQTSKTLKFLPKPDSSHYHLNLHCSVSPRFLWRNSHFKWAYFLPAYLTVEKSHVKKVPMLFWIRSNMSSFARQKKLLASMYAQFRKNKLELWDILFSIIPKRLLIEISIAPYLME